MFSLRSTAIAACMVSAVSAAAGQDAVDRGAQIVRGRCTVCHAVDLIEAQRLTRPGWDREVAKMIAWGAAVDPTQAPAVAAYLASRFGLTRGSAGRLSPERTAQAASLLRSRCTVCHATDLIEAQRLGVEGWQRELDKMMRWGAMLGPGERDLLAEHLAQGETHQP